MHITNVLPSDTDICPSLGSLGLQKVLRLAAMYPFWRLLTQNVLQKIALVYLRPHIWHARTDVPACSRSDSNWFSIKF